MRYFCNEPWRGTKNITTLFSITLSFPLPSSLTPPPIPPSSFLPSPSPVVHQLFPLFLVSSFLVLHFNLSTLTPSFTLLPPPSPLLLSLYWPTRTFPMSSMMILFTCDPFKTSPTSCTRLLCLTWLQETKKQDSSWVSNDAHACTLTTGPRLINGTCPHSHARFIVAK